MHCTATITGRGADTTVPDNPNAIDAAIELTTGETLCTVTLLPDHTGELTTWGCIDNWCDEPGALAIPGTDMQHLVAAIEAAVRNAANAAA